MILASQGVNRPSRENPAPIENYARIPFWMLFHCFLMVVCDFLTFSWILYVPGTLFHCFFLVFHERMVGSQKAPGPDWAQPVRAGPRVLIRMLGLADDWMNGWMGGWMVVVLIMAGGGMGGWLEPVHEKWRTGD